MLTVEKQLAVVAMGLSPKKRARLADLLMQSLVSEKESEIASAWEQEAVSRARAYKRGEFKAVPVDKAFGFRV
ncbi:Putative addiction module component [Opitutaceae bacterium TAV1]|nr:Putative addiction module component [Opitutaceae bacterium TAV1]